MRVVFDTSALFRVLLKSPTCVVKVAKLCQREECWVSKEVVDEFVNSVANKLVEFILAKDKVDILCKAALINSIQLFLVMNVSFHSKPMDEEIENKLSERDESDLHVLRLALEKAPCLLITEDNDLLDLQNELEKRKVRVVRTNEFLREAC